MTSDHADRHARTRLSQLLRRLAGMFYDALVVSALLLMAAAPVVVLAGDEIAAGAGRTLFQTYLLAVVFVFFGGFWVHGGQTVGMRAWRLRLTNVQGGAVTWPRAALRFGAALLSALPAGLGFLWALLDREGCAWHDRLSGTRLRRIP